MEIKSKNRVYSIVDEIENLRVEGELTIDGEGLAKLNGRASSTSGEFGGVAMYYEELPDGQVSLSFSGCPTCGVRMAELVTKEVEKAKAMADGKATETHAEDVGSHDQPDTAVIGIDDAELPPETEVSNMGEDASETSDAHSDTAGEENVEH